MKIKPILTEKSLADAERGVYTFWVDRKLTKYQIKRLINTLFAVHPKTIRTVQYKALVKTSATRKKVTEKARKKAFVVLSANETIDVFGKKSKKK